MNQPSTDITRYFPEKFPKQKIPKAIALIEKIKNAIQNKLPILLSYSGINRIVLPHALFGQYPTSEESTAEKAIGISAYQIYSTEPKESKNGWKTFLLHEVDKLEIFVGEEIRSVLQLNTDDIDGVQLTGKFDVRPDFDAFWRAYQREILEQTPSGNNARKHPELVLLSDFNQKKE